MYEAGYSSPVNIDLSGRQHTRRGKLLIWTLGSLRVLGVVRLNLQEEMGALYASLMMMRRRRRSQPQNLVSQFHFNIVLPLNLFLGTNLQF